MTTESIGIPSERIPPVAEDMASSSKVVAGLLLFLTMILALAAFGVATKEPGHRDDYRPSNSAEAAGHTIGTILGLAIFVAGPGWFGFRAARNASRATRAGALAKRDESYAWRLSGKYIIAVDGAGIPRPELSFKLNSKLRTMLLAVPRAELRT